MQWKVAVAGIALALWGGPSQADENRIYLGAKMGAYDIEADDVDGDDLAVGVYGGYRHNPYLAFEAEYSRLSRDDLGLGDFEADLAVLSVVPTLPLNDSWDLYGKLGWGWLDIELGSPLVAGDDESDEDDDFFWGVGAAWNGSLLHVRAEVQGDADTDLLIFTLGVGFSF